MGCFSPASEGSKSSSGSSASPEETEARQAVIDWVKPYLESTTAGASYSGQLLAETPELFNQAYSQYAGGQYSDISDQATQDLISGKPAYEFDPVKTTARWKETYAEPVMEAWRETMLPTLKENMNMPGSLYSRGTSDYVAQQGSQFYGSNVAPTLYNSLQTGEAMGAQSAENANAMRMQALSLPYQQFGQQAGVAGAYQQQQQAPLSAAYSEYIRQDPYKYAQLLGGLNFTPTSYSSSKSWNDPQGIGLDMLGGAVVGGMGGGGMAGAMTGAALGL